MLALLHLGQQAQPPAHRRALTSVADPALQMLQQSRLLHLHGPVETYQVLRALVATCMALDPPAPAETCLASAPLVHCPCPTLLQ